MPDVTTRQPLPDGWVVIEAVAVLKCFDEDGELRLMLDSTDGLNGWECLGMLTYAAADQQRDLLDATSDSSDEDGDT